MGHRAQRRGTSEPLGAGDPGLRLTLPCRSPVSGQAPVPSLPPTFWLSLTDQASHRPRAAAPDPTLQPLVRRGRGQARTAGRVTRRMQGPQTHHTGRGLCAGGARTLLGAPGVVLHLAWGLESLRNDMRMHRNPGS